MSMQLERVIQEIRNERLRQDAQWGGPAHDDAQPLGYFLEAIDQKFCRKAMMDLVEEDLLDARRRLIQMAALATAAVESLDRRIPGLDGFGPTPKDGPQSTHDRATEDPEINWE